MPRSFRTSEAELCCITVRGVPGCTRSLGCSVSLSLDVGMLSLQGGQICLSENQSIPYLSEVK